MEWHTFVKFLAVEKHYGEMHKQHTPIHMAALFDHKDIVKFLTLEMHCDSTSRNANNHTVHLATMKGHLRMLQFLISEL